MGNDHPIISGDPLTQLIKRVNAQVDAVHKRVDRLKSAGRSPTMPLYLDAEPLDAVKGQYALFDDGPKYYDGAAWVSFGGAAGDLPCIAGSFGTAAAANSTDTAIGSDFISVHTSDGFGDAFGAGDGDSLFGVETLGVFHATVKCYIDSFAAGHEALLRLATTTGIQPDDAPFGGQDRRARFLADDAEIADYLTWEGYFLSMDLESGDEAPPFYPTWILNQASGGSKNYHGNFTCVRVSTVDTTYYPLL